MNALISVIVPVFNSEKYLKECIESIICQDYENLEVILIDDGSTDSSGEICDYFSSRDNRIMALHTVNAGVSAARNTGLDHANGEYVVFVDSDDRLPTSSLRSRVELVYDSDMLIASYNTINDNNMVTSTMPLCICDEWSKDDAIEKLFINSEIGYQGYLWNKIFRKSIIISNQIRFVDEISYNEDRLFVLQYLINCTRIRLSNTMVYYYRENDNGAIGNLKRMNCKNEDKYMSDFKAFDIMKNILFPINKYAYYGCCEKAFFRANYYMRLCDPYSKSLHKRIQSELKINFCEVIKASNKFVNYKEKLWLIKQAITERYF